MAGHCCISKVVDDCQTRSLDQTDNGRILPPFPLHYCYFFYTFGSLPNLCILTDVDNSYLHRILGKDLESSDDLFTIISIPSVPF